MSIRVKVFFPNQCRRWRIADFNELKAKISQIVQDEEYAVQYQDNDRDWIVLEHFDEWTEALHVLSTNASSDDTMILKVSTSPCADEKKIGRSCIEIRRRRVRRRKPQYDAIPLIPLKVSKPVESLNGVPSQTIIVPSGSESEPVDMPIQRSESVSSGDAETMVPHIIRKVPIECAEEEEKAPVEEEVSPAEEEKEEEAPRSQKWYAEEKILKSMGFEDSTLNFHLLNHHKGVLEKVIESLLIIYKKPA